MSDRLPTGIVVSALLRRVNDAGGLAVVRARGDAQAGAVLVVAADRDAAPQVFERGVGPNGRESLIDSTPTNGVGVEEYWRKRRARDPDLWVIELDTPAAQRFAAESLLSD
ncbi:MAG TPA: DUF1491 family protein [Sphingomonas sp.]|jgi:hypothetical protein